MCTGVSFGIEDLFNLSLSLSLSLSLVHNIHENISVIIYKILIGNIATSPRLDESSFSVQFSAPFSVQFYVQS